MSLFKARFRLLPAVVLVFAVSGCVGSLSGSSSSDPAVQCGFVMDASGSATEVIDRLATEERLKREVLGGGCARVSFAVVTGASAATLCKDQYPAVDLRRPDLTNKNRREQAVAQNRDRVSKTLRQLVDCARPEQRKISGSDVFGALKVIADKVPAKAGGSQRNFYVFSDMMENTGEVSFYTADLTDAARRRKIAQPFLRPERKPDFKQAKVYYFGLGGDANTSAKKARVDFVKAFWTEYIDSTGGSFQDGSAA